MGRSNEETAEKDHKSPIAIHYRAFVTTQALIEGSRKGYVGCARPPRTPIFRSIATLAEQLQRFPITSGFYTLK